MTGSLPLCSRCKKDILSPVLGVGGLPLKSCLKCYIYMKDINKRKRKEYNKKAYQKRKTKKAEEKEKPKADDAKAPERRGDEETKTKTGEPRGRLIKKSFTSNNKKFTLIDTKKNPPAIENKKIKSSPVLMASDRLLIREIYSLYKAVKELHEGDNPPALASPALALLRDYLEEATNAHENGTPWAMNNHKEIKAYIKEIKQFLFI